MLRGLVPGLHRVLLVVRVDCRNDSRHHPTGSGCGKLSHRPCADSPSRPDDSTGSVARTLFCVARVAITASLRRRHRTRLSVRSDARGVGHRKWRRDAGRDEVPGCVRLEHELHLARGVQDFDHPILRRRCCAIVLFMKGREHGAHEEIRTLWGKQQMALATGLPRRHLGRIALRFGPMMPARTTRSGGPRRNGSTLACRCAGGDPCVEHRDVRRIERRLRRRRHRPSGISHPIETSLGDGLRTSVNLLKEVQSGEQRKRRPRVGDRGMARRTARLHHCPNVARKRIRAGIGVLRHHGLITAEHQGEQRHEYDAGSDPHAQLVSSTSAYSRVRAREVPGELLGRWIEAS